MRSHSRATVPRLWLMNRIAAPNFAAQVAHEFEDRGFDGDVESSRRLVQDEQRRLRHQRHGDHDALLLAARELVRISMHHGLDVRQPDFVEHGDGPLPGARPAPLAVQHRDFDELPADVITGFRLLIGS